MFIFITYERLSKMKKNTIKARLGDMRKWVEFFVYPPSTNNDTILIQSDHRICKITIATRKGMLSIHRVNGAYFQDLQPFLGAKEVDVSQEIIDAALATQPKSGDKIGGGVVIA